MPARADTPPPSSQPPQVIYLTAQLAQPPPRAAAVANGLTGAAYVCVVLGGYLADATWGRGVTLLVAGSMLVGGLTVLTVSSLLAGRGAQGAALGAFFASQLVTALAFGGIKPNVSAMGADQFDDYDAKGRPLTDKERFFTWYYFFINLGALLASTVLVYVQTNVSWTLGFALPTAGGFFCGWALGGHSLWEAAWRAALVALAPSARGLPPRRPRLPHPSVPPPAHPPPSPSSRGPGPARLHLGLEGIPPPAAGRAAGQPHRPNLCPGLPQPPYGPARRPPGPL